jgi:8-oxo-dGTP pyrophosphatase MutT (NUDIX family)
MQKYHIRAKDSRKISYFFMNAFGTSVKMEPAMAELGDRHEKCIIFHVDSNIAASSQSLEDRIKCKVRKEIYGALAVVRREGKILLLEQPPGKPFAGYWYPPGGSPEGSETVRQAAERETREEFGIIAKPREILKIVPSDYKSLFSVFIECDFIKYLHGEIRPKPDEVRKFGWFTVEDGLKEINLMSATKQLFLSLRLKEAENSH